MNEPRPSPSQPTPPHPPTIRPIGAAAHLPRPAGTGAPPAAPRRIEPPPPHAVPPLPGGLRPGAPPPPAPPADNDLINLEEEDTIPLEDGPSAPAAPSAPRPAAIGAAGPTASAGSTVGGSVQGFANPSKIKVNTGGDKHTYTKFKRQSHVSGTGACRCRSFHGRLSDDGLAFMDDKINEWLDNHPDVEVKFTNCFVGPLEGKVTGEQGLIVVLWY